MVMTRAKSIVGQNFLVFDKPVLARYGLEPTIPIDDTLFLHHTLAEEEPHKLEYLGSLYTDLPYWKDEGKAGEDADYDEETLWHYCATDCIATASVASRLEELAQDSRFKGFDVQRAYKQKLALAELAGRMTRRGLLIDQRTKNELAWTLTAKRTAALTAIHKHTGNSAFNPSPSSPQTRRLLYDELGFPVLKRSKKTGNPSVDIDVLQWLTTFCVNKRQSLVLNSLKAWRRWEKLIGTYIDGLNIHLDGCVHSLWKAALAETGRWRSSDPNGQNWPTRMRSMVVARPGYVFIKFDAEQLELRVQSILAGCNFLLAALESDDPHERAVLALFYGADFTNPASLELARAKYLAKPKEVRKRERTLAKNFEYGTGYEGGFEILFRTIRKQFPKTQERHIKLLYERWKALTPEISRFNRELVARVDHDGYLDSGLGYQRWFFPGGAKPTDIANRPIQGFAGDFINERLLEVDKRLCDSRGEFCSIVTNEHDGFMLEVKENEAEAVAKETKQTLEQPTKMYDKVVVLPFKYEIDHRW